MAPDTFLDTNVLLRHILRNHPEHSPRARAFLERVAQGEVATRTADTVVFETVFTLEKLYRTLRTDIRDAVLPIIELPGIELPDKASFRVVFDLYVRHRSLSFADCYHAVLARQLGLEKILSFDRGFDRLPDIHRIEPA